MSDSAALYIDDLVITGAREARLVNGLSLTIAPGERLGLVGESGSGKSLTALAALRLEPDGLRIRAGALRVAGLDLLSASKQQLREWRAEHVAMVFQDPVAALSPTRTIGAQMADALQRRLGLHRRPALALAHDLAANIGLSAPKRVLSSHPHHLSGGMCQRVLLAMAFAGRPRLIIADEITTAIDPEARRVVLDQLDRSLADSAAGLLFISHDLNLVADYCQTCGVIQRGQIVETGSARDVLIRPQHPYTRQLVSALPGRGTPRHPLLEPRS
ncbi:MAG: ABC transporter ATP-binding protein [Alphaproteobacteria bacterium]|nr:ABC transporter ATP-binding protein [Alphaproteobacteria bacterium]